MCHLASLCYRPRHFNLSQLLWALQEFSVRNFETINGYIKDSWKKKFRPSQWWPILDLAHVRNVLFIFWQLWALNTIHEAYPMQGFKFSCFCRIPAFISWSSNSRTSKFIHFQPVVEVFSPDSRVFQVFQGFFPSGQPTSLPVPGQNVTCLNP